MPVHHRHVLSGDVLFIQAVVHLCLRCSLKAALHCQPKAVGHLNLQARLKA